MGICRQALKFMVVLALSSALILGGGFTGVARAASEDVAMFYDDLSEYGEWAEYEDYGAVWRPGQVGEDWRPYTDGRWVPTDNGYVFETQEPWGWATYHYGNWMLTEGYGWVWVPGRTWYPSTVEWRTSPENTPPDSSYIGWAPIPPPNYVPPPAYAQPSYHPGNPVVDALTAPFWIFASAANFLLGLGQPFAPTYSYINSGVLVPPTYVQVFYPQTVFVRSYYTPAYYPRAYIGGRRHVFAAYNWGPPVGYVSRVTNINQTIINRTIYYNSVNITRIRNVRAPAAVLSRHQYIRQIVPPALAQGRPLPRPNRVENYRMAQANLYKPNILPAPRQVPPMRGQFPRLQRIGVTPSQGIPGTALPPRATMPLTPQMERQIQSLPPNRRFMPAGVRSTRPAAATVPVLQQPLAPGRPGPGVQTQPGPGIQTQPQPAPYERARREEFRPGPSRPGAPAAGTPPGAVQRGAVPPPQDTRAITPEPRRPQELEQRRMPRGARPGQPQPPPQQLQQESLRQPQIQQQQRLQQGQQERFRQQQQEGFRPQGQQQQIRQQQIQQERLRQQQIQPQPRQIRPQQVQQGPVRQQQIQRQPRVQQDQQERSRQQQQERLRSQRQQQQMQQMQQERSRQQQTQPQPRPQPQFRQQQQPRPQSRVMPRVQSQAQSRPQRQAMPRVQSQPQPRPQPQPRVQSQPQPRPQPQQQRQGRGQMGQKNQPH